jgi:hypothetical protein
MRNIRSMIYMTITLTVVRSLLLAPLVQAAPVPETDHRPYSVFFETIGLPAGVELTVSGEHTNPGGHLVPFSTTFFSPGPSAAVPSAPSTTFTFSEFPASLDLGGMTYTLISTSLPTELTTGASGDSLTVIATYASTCLSPTINSQPDSQAVTYGAAVTFTVGAEGTDPLAYQWYKDGLLVQDAMLQTYGISTVVVADSGFYSATVRNDCGQAISELAQLTVHQASQSISFDAPPSPATYASTFTVAPAASSGLPITLVASGSCSVSGYVVTMTSGEGQCTLTASQPGDTNYMAATEVEQTVLAAKAWQIIDFEPPTSPAVYGTTFTLAPLSSSRLPVTLVASGSCSNNDYEVTMTSGEGECTLFFSQPGDTNYLAAIPVEHTVQAAKAGQTITFEQPASPAEYLATFSLTYSASSGLPVSVAASQSCSLLNDTTAQMSLPFGACVLTATQPGDSNYNAASQVVRTVDSPYQGVIFAPIMLTP